MIIIQVLQPALRLFKRLMFIGIFLASSQTGFAQDNKAYPRLIFWPAQLFDEAPVADASSLTLPSTSPGAQLPTAKSGNELAELQLTIDQYQLSISTLLATQGPYSEKLAEQFDSLGSLYQEVGDHPLAIETFEKAMHIVRVNDGLFTLQQLPALQQIIESYTALDNFEEQDKYHEYLYYVSKKNFIDNDPYMIEATQNWAEWNIRANQIEMNDDQNNSIVLSGRPGRSLQNDYIPVRRGNRVIYVPKNQGLNGIDTFSSLSSADLILGPRLKTAIDLYESITETIPEENPEYTSTIIESQRNLAGIHYVVKQQMDAQASQDSINPFNNRIFQTQDDSLLESRSKSKGNNALEFNVELLLSNPDSSEEDIANAMLDLADWNLIYKRYQQARINYQMALDQLTNTELDEEEIALFMNPEPALKIPVYATHPYTPGYYAVTAQDYERKDGFIDVEMTLDQYGLTRGITILGYSPETPITIRRSLLEDLRLSKLRPKFSGGELVTLRDIKLRYYYSH